MKELISVAVFIVGLLIGSPMIKLVHVQVKAVALQKSEKGLPSLTQLTSALRNKRCKQGSTTKPEGKREGNRECLSKP